MNFAGIFQGLRGLLSGSDSRERARALYGEIIVQARNPAFYTDFGVADDVEGRFDLLAIHQFLVLRRLKRAGKIEAHFANVLFETMVQDLEDNLREMGVGDLVVGKKVRKLVEGFLGRAERYEENLKGDDRSGLALTVARNIFADETLVDSPQVQAMVDYILHSARLLKSQKPARLMQAIVAFPPIPSLSQA